MTEETELSPDGRWQIEWRVIKDFNSYFESDSMYEVLVVNLASEKQLATFIRSEFENASGSQNSGVKCVHFAADSSTVIATFEDGSTETIPLLD